MTAKVFIIGSMLCLVACFASVVVFGMVQDGIIKLPDLSRPADTTTEQLPPVRGFLMGFGQAGVVILYLVAIFLLKPWKFADLKSGAWLVVILTIITGIFEWAIYNAAHS